MMVDTFPGESQYLRMDNATRPVVETSTNSDLLWIPYSALVLVSMVILGVSFVRRHLDLVRRKQIELDYQEINLQKRRPRIGRFITGTRMVGCVAVIHDSQSYWILQPNESQQSLDEIEYVCNSHFIYECFEKNECTSIPQVTNNVQSYEDMDYTCISQADEANCYQKNQSLHNAQEVISKADSCKSKECTCILQQTNDVVDTYDVTECTSLSQVVVEIATSEDVEQMCISQENVTYMQR